MAVPGLTWRHAIGVLGLFEAAFTAVTLVVFYRYVDDEMWTPENTGTESDRSIGERVRSEAVSVASSPAILALALLGLVASVASWGVNSYAVVLLQNGYGLSARRANLSLTALFASNAVMMLVGGDLSDRIAPESVIVASYTALALFIGLLASLMIPALVAVALVVLVGGVRTLGSPARSKLADMLSSRGDLGRTFAIITVGIMTGSAMAPPVFGFLIEWAGLRVAFFALAVVSALAVLVALAILRAYGASWSSGAISAPGDD